MTFYYDLSHTQILCVKFSVFSVSDNHIAPSVNGCFRLLDNVMWCSTVTSRKPTGRASNSLREKTNLGTNTPDATVKAISS